MTQAAIPQARPAWHDQAIIDRFLDDAQVWAVVGLSGDPARTAYAIADLITDEDRSEENIIPGAFDPRVAEAVASAVAKAARETGVARL